MEPQQSASLSTIYAPSEAKKDSSSCIICFEHLSPEILAASPRMKCCHDKTLCKQCWEQYLATEFDQKKKSPILIICPSAPCKETIPEEVFLSNAGEATLRRYKSVMKTVPSDDHYSTIADFCYEYDAEGVLKHKETGEKFHFVSQLHYDALGEIIGIYVQKKLIEFGLKEVWLPLDEKDATAPRVNIFLSDDALTNPERLLLIIQGSGVVRAGQWARSLCINESLSWGTILPYLKKASQGGFGMIVLNPNFVAVQVPPPTKPTRKQMLTPTVRTFGENDTKPAFELRGILGLSDRVSHSLYVWDNFVAKSKAREVFIVAHSAGGDATMGLLRNRESDVISKLKCVAFTDSVHTVLPKESSAVRKFLTTRAVNFVASREPLDTVIPPVQLGGSDGCPCVSAGHPKHEYTSQSAIESVFRFLALHSEPANRSALARSKDYLAKLFGGGPPPEPVPRSSSTSPPVTSSSPPIARSRSPEREARSGEKERVKKEKDPDRKSNRGSRTASSTAVDVVKPEKEKGSSPPDANK